MIIKPNVENRAIRKLLWQKRNPFYLSGIVILVVIGYIGSKNILHGDTPSSVLIAYILFGYVLYFIFALLYTKIAYKIFSKEEIENKKRELEESIAYKATSGRLRIFRTIIISILIFVAFIGIVVLSSFI